MRFRATAVVESPVAISAKRATGNDLATQPFLPGATIRGALAMSYLEAGSADDATFKSMFLEEKVRFCDMRKDGAMPWPLSARRCREHEDHQLRDVLIGWGARKGDPVIKMRLECGDSRSGEMCRSKIGVPGGFCLYNAKTGQYESVEVGTRRVAHSAIDPHLLRARNGEFHSSRVIHADQTFEGLVYASGSGEAALRAFVKDGRTMYVGRGRSRGQGRITVSLSPEPDTTLEEMVDRIEALNRVAGEMSATLKGQILFTCTLGSPTILLDEWLCSKGGMEASDIAAGQLEEYKPFGITRAVDVAGWHAKAQLPKAEVRALSAGSCFLFAKRASPGEDRSAEYRRVAAVLRRAEEEGLGERNEEGFGEAWFCVPFHYELAEGA